MPAYTKSQIICLIKKTLLEIQQRQKQRQRVGFLSYQSYKKSKYEMRRRSPRFRENTLTSDFELLKLNRLSKSMSACLENIRQATTKPAILSHLIKLYETKSLDIDVKLKLEKVIKVLEPKAKDEVMECDAFGNPSLRSEFESMLSLRLLQHGDVTALQAINDKLIDYLTRHHIALLIDRGEDIIKSLERFKLLYNRDIDGVSAVIRLLSQPLVVNGQNRPQTISMMATLHLMLFNYRHIYEPERDMSGEENKLEVLKLRERYHRQVRPTGDRELFAPDIRGRLNVYSKKRSRALGICDDESMLDEFENFHDYVFTPHKYRARGDETSLLVQHFREKGVPFIAGPSGTAADVIEGLQFLMPEFSESDYQSYLNLLAAAEVAQGHHSFCEVVLTAAHAGVLPQVKTINLDQDFWQRLDYDVVYNQFLSNQFKATKAYQKLYQSYAQYLGAPKSLEAIHKKKLGTVVREISSRTVSKKVSKQFSQAPYWKVYPYQADLPAKKDDFVRALSKRSIDFVRVQTADLCKEEMHLLRFFMMQPIALTHYKSDAWSMVNGSSTLLSNSELKRRGIDFVSHSDDDVECMRNNDYVFFRFELKHQPKISRFGHSALVIDGRHPAIFSHLNVSVVDMLDPLSASTIESLDIIPWGELREIEGSPEFYSDDLYYNIPFRYPTTGRQHSFDVTKHFFCGEHILEGLARSLIIELRNIGGLFHKEVLNHFKTTDCFDNSKTFVACSHMVNQFLSLFFRCEARVPRSVNLAKLSFNRSKVSELEDAIVDGDLMSVRKQLDGMVLDKEDHSRYFEELVFSGIGHYILSYLFAHGYTLDSDTLSEMMQLEQPLASVSVNSIKLLVKYCDLLGFNHKKKTRDGDSLLHLFAKAANYPVVETLLELGADPTIQNLDGKCFFDYLPNDLQEKYQERVVDMDVGEDMITLPMSCRLA